jgi:hypothetical protein
VDLENELRRVLHTRDVPTSVQDPVGPIHAGMLRRRRTRRLQVASATLGVVAVALAASTLQPPSLLHRSTPAQQPTALPTPNAVQPSPEAPVPPRFGALDLSFVSKDHGWALGSSPCSVGRCGSVLATSDGGETWSVRTMPDAALPDSAGAFSADCAVRTCVSHLRFASTEVGYAFGPGLAMTKDGGRTWTNAPTGGEVTGLEAAGGNVVRLVNRTSCPGCTFDVETADIGSPDWTRTYSTPQVGAAGAQLVRQGRDVAVLLTGHTAGGAASASSTLVLSGDSGATWTERADPCGRPTATTELDTRQLALAPGNVAVALCVERTTQAASVRTSTDSGATFGPQHALPGSAPSSLITSAPGVLLAAVRGDVLRSTDDGRGWDTVLSRPGEGTPSFLQFTTSTVATWIGQDNTRYSRTSDAGKTWSRSSFS